MEVFRLLSKKFVLGKFLFITASMETFDILLSALETEITSMCSESLCYISSKLMPTLRREIYTVGVIITFNSIFYVCARF